VLRTSFRINIYFVSDLFSPFTFLLSFKIFQYDILYIGDYWIPPPDPTMSPTMPCPECEECSTSTSSTKQTSLSTATTASLAMAGIGGAAIVLVLGAIHKYCTRGRRSEYSPIPN
jgi:hypothetical protein